MSAISKQQGQAINPHHAIMYAVSNVVGSLVFGKRLDYDSEKFRKYMDIMIESFTVSGRMSLYYIERRSSTNNNSTP